MSLKSGIRKSLPQGPGLNCLYKKQNKCRRYRKVPWKINHGIFNVVYTVDKVYGRRLYIDSTYKMPTFRTLKSSQSKSRRSRSAGGKTTFTSSYLKVSLQLIPRISILSPQSFRALLMLPAQLQSLPMTT
jgi:hypothetical protein